MVKKSGKQSEKKPGKIRKNRKKNQEKKLVKKKKSESSNAQKFKN